MRRSNSAFFLCDAAFLSDSRFRALARRLPDPDDFNSAVGAWIVALAAARRNGSPNLDCALETDSRFIEDLRIVGLLIETGFRREPFEAWAPMSPQQAAAGRARAASGTRNDAGQFTSALATLDPTVQPSPPLLSNQLTSSTEGVQGEPDAFEAFHRRTGQVPGQKLRVWLNELSGRFGEGNVATRIAAVPLDDRNPPDYLRAIGAELAVQEHRAEKAERADELRRIEEKRAPIVLRPTPIVISEEEAERIAAEYVAEFGGKHA